MTVAFKIYKQVRRSVDWLRIPDSSLTNVRLNNLNVQCFSMDRGSAFGLNCSCGRTFSNLTALGNHQNACKKNKKRLSNALAKARNLLADRKRKAQSQDADQHASISSTSVAEHDINSEVRTKRYHGMTIDRNVLHRFQG